MLTAGSETFGYDNNGNLITKTSEGNVTNYSWDFNDMLTQVTNGSNNYIYRYDGLGSRVARIENGAEKRYVSGLVETDSSGNIIAYYVYGLGLISKITPTNQSYFYHFDGVGSTIGMSDSLGTMVNKYAYDAFGKVLNQEETIPNPFKYVGQFGVMDEENGLLYMRARYYDPDVGRFISKDPIGILGGLNMFTYVQNNPVNYTDPYGLQGKSKNSGTGVSKGRLWLSVGVKILGIGIIGVGVIIEAPVVIVIGIGVEVGYMTYEAIQAYMEGKEAIEKHKEDLNKACEEQ
jgi:RHS repeat-associated protein